MTKQFYFGQKPHRVIYTNSEGESKEYISVLECSKEVKIRRATIIDCCSSSSFGRTISKGKHKGEHFRYKYPSNALRLQKKKLWKRYLELKQTEETEEAVFPAPLEEGWKAQIKQTEKHEAWIASMREKFAKL